MQNLNWVLIFPTTFFTVLTSNSVVNQDLINFWEARNFIEPGLNIFADFDKIIVPILNDDNEFSMILVSFPSKKLIYY